MTISDASRPAAPPRAGAATKALGFWPVFALVLVTDVVTKQIAARTLVPHVPRRVIGEWVQFTLAFNPGMAFSLHVGSASRWFFSLVAIGVLFMLWRLYREAPPADLWRGIALGLICAGAVGNLLDRLQSARGVIDFIDVGVRAWRFYTFNVADSGVSVGTVLLVWSLWREGRRARARG